MLKPLVIVPREGPVAKQPDTKPPRAITQYDLARQLGIGQKTVSRALAGEARVSPTLRARIEAAADHLGYRPNQSARSIKNRRFDTAMLLQVVAKSHHRLAPGIVDGVADGLAEAGRPLLIERLVLAELAAGGATPRALRQAMVDGILVHVDVEPAAAIEALLATSGLPLVWINRRRPMDAVCPDDAAAAVLMVKRLTAAGHRRIAWLDQQIGYRDPAELHYSRTLRAEGYHSAMQAAGLTPMLLSPSYDPGEGEQQAWLEATLRSARPSAVACYSRYEALAVLYAAGRLGLRLPEDLSLITINHESLVAGLRIDVAVLPTAHMGRAAAAMLVQRIATGQPVPSVAIPFGLIPGASVAPPA